MRRGLFQIWTNFDDLLDVWTHADSLYASEETLCIVIDVKRSFNTTGGIDVYCKVCFPHCVGWINGNFLEEV